MRITKVRLSNLNSLVGEWEVDFTADDFTADGIFAIVGPTGAGKTTILDAICLALYGRTPRLDRVNKSSNEIMSRQAGECFAEVEFTTAHGRFRSQWSQHRARRRPDGDLQPARHEVSDMDTGTPLGEKLRDSADEVERVTGMDFDRFTRSMLLAQGDFAKFLNAAPDERAPILEKITGTQVYSDISRHVHELLTGKAKELEEARQVLAGIEVLSEEQEAQLRAELAVAEEAAHGHEARVNELAAAVAWLEHLDRLSAALRDMAEKDADLAADEAAFEPSRTRLRRATAALELDAEFAELRNLRHLQHRETAELQSKQGDVEGKQRAVDEAEAAQLAADAVWREARQANDDAAPVLVEVRRLDAAITEKQKPIATAAAALADRRAELRTLDESAAAAKEERAVHEESLRGLREELRRTSVDEGLVSDYAGIVERLDGLGRLRDKIQLTHDSLTAARAASAGASDAVTAAEEIVQAKVIEADQAHAVLQSAQEQRTAALDGTTLPELREHRDSLAARRELLDSAVAAGTEVTELNEEAASLVVQARKVRDARTAAQDRRTDLAEKESTLTEDVVRLDERVRLLNRIGSFDQAREELADGEPCPLCGSHEHPFARGNVPQPKEAERDLSHAKQAHDGVRQQLHQIDVDMVGYDHDLSEIERRQAAVSAERAVLRDKLATWCSQLHVALPAGEDADEALHAQLAALHAETTEQYAATTDSVRRAEDIEDAIKSARDAVDQTSRAVTDAQQAAATAQFRATQAVEEATRLQVELQGQENEFSHGTDRLSDALRPYGVELPTGGEETIDDAFDYSEVARILRGRRDAWVQRDRAARELEKAIAEMATHASSQAATRAGISEAIAATELHLAELQVDLEDARGQRRELFGDKDPNAEEAQLNSVVEAARSTLREAETTASQARHHLDQLTARIAELTASVATRGEELASRETAFTQRLAASEFDDEAAYREAAMPAEERAKLDSAARALAQRRTELVATRRQTEEELAAERAKAVTTATVDELRPQLEAEKLAISAANQEVGAKRQSLAGNDRAKHDSSEARDVMLRREREHRRWVDLHELIGSSDGKKFRNFAQGLTFEIMINHANRQLRRMNDRYVLIRDEDNPLQLSVVDDYQAGEIRSTRNLSGGESFVVSLALALGLSQMASRNVRVDSLFLDEGFGTLDEDALDNALTTLSSLQQDGKMIGIISHVGALKERIRAQIVVTPKAGGRSVLSGPGCTHR